MVESRQLCDRVPVLGNFPCNRLQIHRLPLTFVKSWQASAEGSKYTLWMERCGICMLNRSNKSRNASMMQPPTILSLWIVLFIVIDIILRGTICRIVLMTPPKDTVEIVLPFCYPRFVSTLCCKPKTFCAQGCEQKHS